jgi:hypothetical protein
MPARAESTLARAERKRGIRCGIAVSLARDLRRRVSLRTRDAHRPALRVGGPHLPGVDHWDLVRDRRVREAVADFLGVFRPLASG